MFFLRGAVSKVSDKLASEIRKALLYLIIFLKNNYLRYQKKIVQYPLISQISSSKEPQNSQRIHIIEHSRSHLQK